MIICRVTISTLMHHKCASQMWHSQDQICDEEERKGDNCLKSQKIKVELREDAKLYITKIFGEGGQVWNIYCYP